MNHNSAAAKILWIATWLGNFLLTGLAFFLAVTHEGPLDAVVFLTVAVCILSGNLLPLAYYYVSFLWAQATLEAEQVEASETLREASARVQELHGRFEELQSTLAKTVLLARQVPERIEEKARSLDEIFGALDVGHLEGLSARVDAAADKAAEASSRLDDVAALISGEMEARRHLTEALERMARESARVGEEEVEVEEEVEEEEEVEVEEEEEEEEEVEEEEEGEGEEEGEEEEEEEVDVVGVVGEEDAEEEEDFGMEEALVEEDLEEVPVEEAPVSRKRERKVREREPDLFAAEPVDVAKPTRTGNGDTVLVARAMIGIANRLYVRGEGAGLSPEKGVALELTGIGEYRWVGKGLQDPVKIRILLNDEEPAEGGELLLEPGAIVEVRPQFARR